jgi:CheY-like chemotaxis protein
LRLPLLSTAQVGGVPSLAPALAKAANASPPRRILVVDDNRDAASALAELLSLFGHDVVLAEDGPAALAVAEIGQPFDVALLDIGLPVMNGYELAQALRQRMADRPLRLVALTGYGLASDVEKSRRSGFDEHLVKPVEIDALLASIGTTGRLADGQC